MVLLLLGACLNETRLIHQLDGEVLAQQQRVHMLEERLANCDRSDGPDPIYPELIQALLDQPIAVGRVGGTTILTISSDDLFSAGAALRVEAAATLDLIAMALKLHPERRVTITVHTDDQLVDKALRRTFPTNWELSSARALVLVRELADNHGVPADMLTAAARSDREPITPNDTPEGRSLNRRVVFAISPGVTR